MTEVPYGLASLREFFVEGWILLALLMIADRAARAWKPELVDPLWRIGLASLLLFTLSGPLLPAWSLHILDSAPDVQEARLAAMQPVSDQALELDLPSAPDTIKGPGLLQVAGGIWLVGALGIGVLLVAERLRLLRAAKRWTRVADPELLSIVDRAVQTQGLKRRPRVVWRPSPGAACTWGLVRPVIALPAAAGSWPRERLAHVLCHELAHIRRRDHLLFSVAALTCMLHWPNPLVWLARSRLLEEAESACDQRVLRAGASPSHYAETLLGLQRNVGSRTAWTEASMARKGSLALRIRAVLQPGLPTKPPSLASRLLLAGICGLVGVAVVSAEVVPSERSGSAPDPPASSLEPSFEAIHVHHGPSNPLGMSIGPVRRKTIDNECWDRTVRNRSFNRNEERGTWTLDWSSGACQARIRLDGSAAWGPGGALSLEAGGRLLLEESTPRGRWRLVAKSTGGETIDLEAEGPAEVRENYDWDRWLRSRLALLQKHYPVAVQDHR